MLYVYFICKKLDLFTVQQGPLSPAQCNPHPMMPKKASRVVVELLGDTPPKRYNCVVKLPVSDTESYK